MPSGAFLCDLLDLFADGLYEPFDCLGPVASFGPDFSSGPHLGPHGCGLQKARVNLECTSC